MADGLKALAVLKAYLNEHDWLYIEAAEDILRGLIEGKAASWHWSARLTSDGGFLRFASVCPLAVPEARRRVVAEYLCRANFGLSFGTFDLDFNDGEVICRTALPTCGRSVNLKAIEYLVCTNMYLMELYLPGLVRLIAGRSTPAREAALADAPPADEAGEEEDEDEEEIDLDLDLPEEDTLTN